MNGIVMYNCLVRRNFVLWVIAVATVILSLFFSMFQHPYKIISPIQTDKLTTTPVPIVKEKSLFIPYWKVNFTQSDISDFSNIIYFGIASDANGIDTTTDGYKNITTFVKNAGGKEKILTVRLMDQTINDTLLQNNNLQQKIIDQSIATAKQYGFSGILVDFEFNALRFESVLQHVTNFYKNFSEKTKRNTIKFYIIFYGDSFYRARPYDIQTITKDADRVFVMAYDFHKASGNPGPNFPLRELPTEDYDFKKMIGDFLHVVPRTKITVIFGLYGYDWKVTDKGDSVNTATAISFAEIQKKFYPVCPFPVCHIIRDNLSSETNILYTDSLGEKHSLWYEDMTSIEKKEAFLFTKGIGSTAFWIFGYY